MSPPVDEYPSSSEFYQGVYPAAITELRPAGRTGAVLMRIQQGAGDWSSAATPDIVVVRPPINGVRATLDFGAGRFRTDTPVNSFAVIPPHSAAFVLVEAEQRLEMLGLPYEGLVALAGADVRLSRDGDFGVLHALMPHDLEIGLLFDRMFREMELGSPRGALYADSILLHLTARLLELRDGALGEADAAARGGLAPWQIKRVCEVMIAAMDAGEVEASLADLALTVGLSANHFCRSFALSMGLPPHRWMTERRMERATMLLGDGKLGVTDIAIALGYTSQSAFGRAYARVTGVTPSARRRELLS